MTAPEPMPPDFTVTYTETPQDGDTLITAEFHGLTISFLRGADTDFELEVQKRLAAKSIWDVMQVRGAVN